MAASAQVIDPPAGSEVSRTGDIRLRLTSSPVGQLRAIHINVSFGSAMPQEVAYRRTGSDPVEDVFPIPYEDSEIVEGVEGSEDVYTVTLRRRKGWPFPPIVNVQVYNDAGGI